MDHYLAATSDLAPRPFRFEEQHAPHIEFIAVAFDPAKLEKPWTPKSIDDAPREYLLENTRAIGGFPDIPSCLRRVREFNQARINNLSAWSYVARRSPDGSPGLAISPFSYHVMRIAQPKCWKPKSLLDFPPEAELCHLDHQNWDAAKSMSLLEAAEEVAEFNRKKVKERRGRWMRTVRWDVIVAIEFDDGGHKMKLKLFGSRVLVNYSKSMQGHLVNASWLPQDALVSFR